MKHSFYAQCVFSLIVCFLFIHSSNIQANTSQAKLDLNVIVKEKLESFTPADNAVLQAINNFDAVLGVFRVMTNEGSGFVIDVSSEKNPACQSTLEREDYHEFCGDFSENPTIIEYRVYVDTSTESSPFLSYLTNSQGESGYTSCPQSQNQDADLLISGELNRANITIHADETASYISENAGDITVKACLHPDTVAGLKVKEGESFLQETITLTFNKSSS